MARKTVSVRVIAPKPNLLILGASGNVARAFLRRLGGRRVHFGRLVLLDKSKQVLSDPVLEHHRLAYQFLHRRLRLPADQVAYRRLLREKQIHLVLDLSDMNTLPVFTATDEMGVSYLNTSLNDDQRGSAEITAVLHPTRERPRRAAHILCSGMNPGVVNIWVRDGVYRHGIPREIVHFEYDTSMATDGWRPLVTWSRREFLTESVWEPTGCVQDGKPVLFATNALQNRENMRDILRPVLPQRFYPRGMLVSHEENLTLGQTLGVSSKFIYAIHPKTMAYLCRKFRRYGTVKESDLAIGDNTTIPLGGADSIGVYLEYPQHRVYYLHTTENHTVIGTNATCAQVAVGVYSALFTLLRNRLPPRIYFPEDLYETLYPHIVFCNMRVEYFVFERRKRSWVLHEHLPHLRPSFLRNREQFVI